MPGSELKRLGLMDIFALSLFTYELCAGVHGTQATGAGQGRQGVGHRLLPVPLLLHLSCQEAAGVLGGTPGLPLSQLNNVQYTYQNHSYMMYILWVRWTHGE